MGKRRMEPGEDNSTVLEEGIFDLNCINVHIFMFPTFVFFEVDKGLES